MNEQPMILRALCALAITAGLVACGSSDDDGEGSGQDAGAPDSGAGDVLTPDTTPDPDAGPGPDVEPVSDVLPEPDTQPEPDVVPDVEPEPDVVPDVEPQPDAEPDVVDAADGSAEPDVIVEPALPSSCETDETGEFGDGATAVSLDGERRLLSLRRDYNWGGFDESRYTYDESGRVLTEYEASLSSTGDSGFFSATISYSYSAPAPSLAGTFAEEQDYETDGSADYVQTGTQDEFGRVLTRDETDSEGTLLASATFEYLDGDPTGNPIGTEQDYDGDGTIDYSEVPTVVDGLLTEVLITQPDSTPPSIRRVYTYDTEGRLILLQRDESNDGSFEIRVVRTWLSADVWVETSFDGDDTEPFNYQLIRYYPGTMLVQQQVFLTTAACSYSLTDYNMEGVGIAYEYGQFDAADATSCIALLEGGTIPPRGYTRDEYGEFGPTLNVVDADGDGVFESESMITYLPEGYVETQTVITRVDGVEESSDVATSVVTRDDAGRLLTWDLFRDGAEFSSESLEWTYDENGRIMQFTESYRFGESTSTGLWEYAYDSEGRRTLLRETSSFFETPREEVSTYEGPFPWDTCRPFEDEEGFGSDD